MLRCGRCVLGREDPVVIRMAFPDLQDSLNTRASLNSAPRALSFALVNIDEPVVEVLPPGSEALSGRRAQSIRTVATSRSRYGSGIRGSWPRCCARMPVNASWIPWPISTAAARYAASSSKESTRSRWFSPSSNRTRGRTRETFSHSVARWKIRRSVERSRLTVAT